MTPVSHEASGAGGIVLVDAWKMEVQGWDSQKKYLPTPLLDVYKYCMATNIAPMTSVLTKHVGQSLRTCRRHTNAYSAVYIVPLDFNMPVLFNDIVSTLNPLFLKIKF